jgi:prepilin-type N-terminal cleavage/methylation domain-containing protein
MPHATVTGATPTPCRPALRVAGFTLIELMVVIAIIAVLVGLLFPALGMARRSARNAETKSLIHSITGAIQSFNADHQRSPGYFSHFAMASAQNGGLGGTTSMGFTQMENAMLELAGGLITESEFDATGGRDVTSQEALQFDLSLGPSNAYETAYIRPGKMYDSNNNGAYIALSADVLRPMPIAGQFNNATNYYPLPTINHTVDFPNATQTAMNYVMDPFDRPLLLWTADPLARYTVSEGDTSIPGASDTFARDAGPANPNGPRALFYYYTNSGILRMHSIASSRGRQPMGGGLLRPANDMNEDQRSATLEALLGNPAFRTRGEINGRVRPLRPLGTNIVWSAGADGVFLKADGVREAQFYSGPSYPLKANNASTSMFDDIIIPVP